MKKLLYLSGYILFLTGGITSAADVSDVKNIDDSQNGFYHQVKTYDDGSIEIMSTPTSRFDGWDNFVSSASAIANYDSNGKLSEFTINAVASTKFRTNPDGSVSPCTFSFPH
ncbi:MAG: hypothetical protein IJ830_00325 [Alphaproteobacteria bacterium]|nr:hypothetical protein [Alphaproteobacteria bacterium]